MPSIHAFIISWPSRHHDAVSIANQVLNKADQVSIVYSDCEPLMLAVAIYTQISIR
jgi:hypothetical protein